MDCPDCGYMITAFARECARCKRIGKPQLVKNPMQPRVKPLPIASEVAVQALAVQALDPSGLAIPEAEASQHLRACAFCNNLDVQKLSVIVDSGITQSSTSETTHEGIDTGDGVTPATSVSSEANTAATQLASALSPPQRPWLHDYNTGLVMSLVLIGLVGFCIGCAIFSSNLDGGMLFILGGIAIIIGVPYSEAIAAQKRKEEHAADESDWQEQMANWDCLFYCSCCDHVCDPRHKRCVPSHMMRQLL